MKQLRFLLQIYFKVAGLFLHHFAHFYRLSAFTKNLQAKQNSEPIEEFYDEIKTGQKSTSDNRYHRSEIRCRNRSATLMHIMHQMYFQK